MLFRHCFNTTEKQGAKARKSHIGHQAFSTRLVGFPIILQHWTRESERESLNDEL
jgi:hypothetical protein